MRLFFVRRIDQHETGDALGTFRRDETRGETTRRGADKNPGAGNAAAVEQLLELASGAACRARRRSRIAVTEPSPVVRADPRESGDLRLDEAPSNGRPSQPGLENHRRLARAGAPDMQSVPSDVHEPSRRWRLRQLLARREPLKCGARTSRHDEPGAQTDENARRPTPHVDSPAEGGRPARTRISRAGVRRQGPALMHATSAPGRQPRRPPPAARPRLQR